MYASMTNKRPSLWDVLFRRDKVAKEIVGDREVSQAAKANEAALHNLKLMFGELLDENQRLRDERETRERGEH